MLDYVIILMLVVILALMILQLLKNSNAPIIKNEKQVLIDTSVLIDGRLLDVVSSGFLNFELITPRFVLLELQNIADSTDSIRRLRGRRGLEVLNQIVQLAKHKVIDEDPVHIKEVDSKLIYLANKYKANIITTDYNLNKVASVEGIGVLNINDLANSLKAVLIPGEKFNIKIIQAGKEKGQGVGYLPDGTMIVVDKASKMINKNVNIVVNKIFQTSAGKMIFAEIV
jgi:uncharacterized protein YacL